MSPRVPETDLKDVWQNLETEKTTVSIEQIQLKAMEFQRENRRDSIARLVFAVLASAFCGFVVITARSTTVRTVAAVVAAMLLTNAIRSVYRAFRGTRPWSSCLEFYRSELKKQQAFAALPMWQMIAALLIIAWLLPGAVQRSDTDPLRMVLPAVLFTAAGLLVLMALRKFHARRVQGDLEALNNFEKEDHAGGSDG